MSRQVQWESGSLWLRLKAQAEHGKKTGSLKSINTTAETVESGGIPFKVYVLANLAKKEKAKKQQGKTKPDNPFLPYEEDLYVTDISETHLCLLNKFNVVDHHFLIVTKAFESQENWLNLADFEALAKCLLEVDGLGFFNGGTVAGSSQPHKHLQVVPTAGESVPIERAIAPLKKGVVGRSPLLPYHHAILRWQTLPSPQQILENYHQLLNAIGIISEHWQGTQTAPYNFLCTREWMMLVPRSQEKYANISVNSLGFAGSLLVKNKAMLDQLIAMSPIELLSIVGLNPSR
ncbi:MAG: phosphorylase [Leptolyngbya foveolarum]|uniref:Phosphorylase n=1 Tax=Leptolyngbya foveolarum TaxID=47253 RepID=A0A2W4UF25_9CYAN|nr:MAG: phosphorylase [Leptolyngbya foveolarum]